MAQTKRLLGPHGQAARQYGEELRVSGEAFSPQTLDTIRALVDEDCDVDAAPQKSVFGFIRKAAPMLDPVSNPVSLHSRSGSGLQSYPELHALESSDIAAGRARSKVHSTQAPSLMVRCLRSPRCVALVLLGAAVMGRTWLLGAL